jgi:hypothetical protein
MLAGKSACERSEPAMRGERAYVSFGNPKAWVSTTLESEAVVTAENEATCWCV